MKQSIGLDLEAADIPEADRMRWKLHALRSYVRDTEHTQGFVFGCSRPTQLWAWTVFWSFGKSAGVEQSMRAAKLKAEDCARQVEEHWPNRRAPEPMLEGSLE